MKEVLNNIIKLVVYLIAVGVPLLPYLTAQPNSAPKDTFIARGNERIRNGESVIYQKKEAFLNLTCNANKAFPAAVLVWTWKGVEQARSNQTHVTVNDDGTVNTVLPLSERIVDLAEYERFVCTINHNILAGKHKRLVVYAYHEPVDEGDKVELQLKVLPIYKYRNVNLDAKFSSEKGTVTHVIWYLQSHLFNKKTTLVRFECRRTDNKDGAKNTTAFFRSESAPNCHTGKSILRIPRLDGTWLGDVYMTAYKKSGDFYTGFTYLAIYSVPKVVCSRDPTNTNCTCVLSESYLLLYAYFIKDGKRQANCDEEIDRIEEDYIIQICSVPLNESTKDLEFVVNYRNESLRYVTKKQKVCAGDYTPTEASTIPPTPTAEPQSTDVKTILIILVVVCIVIAASIFAVTVYKMRQKKEQSTTRVKQKKMEKLYVDMHKKRERSLKVK